jgi:hypothetical protein
MPRETLKKSTGRLKVETAVSLRQTKPAKAGRLARLQKQNTVKPSSKSSGKTETPRKKPQSQIKEAEKISFWFIPARIAFLLNGLCFLFFSLIAFLQILQSHSVLKTFLALPFDPTISSNYLLELSGSLALIGSLLFFHAARHPQKYSWLYFFLVLFALPANFLSNLSKLQSEIPQQFYNFIYYDTVVIAVLWAIYLLSLFSYFKSIKNNN